jgi:hypothetical protein
MAETKEDLIVLIQEVSRRAGTSTVPRHQFLREAKVSERMVQRLFGTYNALVEAAGLEPMRFPGAGGTYSDADLLAEVVRVLRLPEAKMTQVFFDQHGEVSTSVCARRFGGWLGTLRAAAEILDPVEDRLLLAKLAEYLSPAQERETSQTSEPGTDDGPERETLPHALPDSSSVEARNLYGDFINFRGLQHAPVNEQGVVFLFGMICRELGYVVEIVRSGFPDCEAKRRVRDRPGKWERVRIEFEFESRTFRTHGHDPDQCDVVVCWDHNWPECPLEVVELRGLIAKLPSAV